MMADKSRRYATDVALIYPVRCELQAGLMIKLRKHFKWPLHLTNTWNDAIKTIPMVFAKYIFLYFLMIIRDRRHENLNSHRHRVVQIKTALAKPMITMITTRQFVSSENARRGR